MRGTDPFEPDGATDWTTVPPDRTDEVWSIAGDDADAVYVGAIDGVPVFHGDGTVFRAVVDAARDEVSPIPGTERPLEADESLADVLVEIRERRGWETLSTYAVSRLRDEREG